MMNEYVICEKENLTAIANAVRASTGSTQTFNVSELSAITVNTLAAGGVMPDVSGQIAEHNTATDAHSDIRAAIPTATSQLTNDSGYLTQETDPTVPAWAKEANPPTYTASEVGADASGTASSAVSAHNTNTSAHSDIRARLLPSVTASDAGKFLCVNSSGSWAASALENAEEVSF